MYKKEGIVIKEEQNKKCLNIQVMQKTCLRNSNSAKNATN